MTPNDIEVLIHCHTSPTKHPRYDAPAVASSLSKFETNGLIEMHDGVYTTTTKGSAHIMQLCSLPWPEMAYVDQNGEVITL